MKIKTILNVLFSGLLINAGSLHAADCPCDGGTAEYSVDCSGDGTPDACSSDDCPPCSEKNPNPSTPGYECCGEEEWNPNSPWGNKTTLSELDFTQIINAANNALNMTPTQAGCSFNDPEVTGSIEYESKKDCCEDELKNLSKFSGSVNLSLSASCNIPIPFASVPKVAETYLILSAGVGGSVTAAVEETCDSDQVCFNVDLGVSGGVGGMLSILLGIVEAEAFLALTGNVDAGYCTNDGFSGVNICFGSVTGTVETRAAWGLARTSYSYTYELSNC